MISCDFEKARDATILRAIETSKTINDKAEDVFRKEVDEKKDNKPFRNYKPLPAAFSQLVHPNRSKSESITSRPSHGPRT
ncbi:MAG: hypothetical protein ACLQIB_22945 [Isosphaeraceae bacterium]